MEAAAPVRRFAGSLSELGNLIRFVNLCAADFATRQFGTRTRRSCPLLSIVANAGELRYCAVPYAPVHDLPCLVRVQLHRRTSCGDKHLISAGFSFYLEDLPDVREANDVVEAKLTIPSCIACRSWLRGLREGCLPLR